MGFTKLDERILQSSIMAEDSDSFKVWIAILASCRQDGIAPISSIFLSSVCRLPIEKIDKSLKILESPDLRSRSIEDEGKRIKRVDGGYFVINYSKYRDHSYSKKPEAIRKRNYRERKGMGHECPKVSQSMGHNGTLTGHSASASASASNNKENSSSLAILTKWNSFAELHGLAKITEIEKGSSREVHLRKIAKKKGFNFASLLEIMGKSPFLLGEVEPKAGGKRFFATFDWIINKTNYQKVIEGNYLDRTPEDEKPGAWIKKMEKEEKEEKEKRQKTEDKNGKDDQEDF